MLNEYSTRRDRHVQFTVLFIIVGVVCGTYGYLNLSGAFEEDPLLPWNKQTTANLATLATFAETIGLVVVGPLADVFDQKSLLAANALTVFHGLLVMSLSSNVALIFVSVGAVAFMKGILWPCIGAMIANNVSPDVQDQTFLLASVGSRMGDILSSVSLSFLLLTMALSWRRALTVQLLFVVLIIGLGLWLSPRHIAAPRDALPSITGQIRKCWRLLCDLDGWLAFCTLLGTYCAWALQSYLVVLLQDTFGLEPGEAAIWSVCFPIGCVAGLAAGAMNSAIFGQNVGRALHVIQGILGVIAMGVLSCFHFPVITTTVLLAFAGFGFVVPAYAPFLIYVAHCVPGDRAFRLAMLDGVASLFSVLLTMLYGTMRAHSKHVVAHQLYGLTSVGLAFATIAMAVLYWRLRNSKRGLNEDYWQSSD